MPWRERWRKTRDPYVVWVSEIMLQQTVIKAVIPVYERFLARFPDLRALAAAEEDEIRSAVRGLGYYRRFRLMHAAARELVARGSKWPETYEGLKALPGIGDYTAAAIASIAFSVPKAVVDGNVERVMSRLVDWRGPPSAPEVKGTFRELAQSMMVVERPGDFNQALMELGQTLCRPGGAPDCEACPLAFGCLARQRGSQALAPGRNPRKEATPVAMRLTIVRRGEKVALLERPSEARFLKRTLGFPTEIKVGSRFLPDGGSWQLTKNEPIGKVRHSITHHKIEAAVVTAATPPKGARITWLPAREVEEHLVSNLDRKAWRVFLKRSQGQVVTHL